MMQYSHIMEKILIKMGCGFIIKEDGLLDMQLLKFHRLLKLYIPLAEQILALKGAGYHMF